MSKEAWLPDPLREYDYRWFDGAAWTSDVSRAGAAAQRPYDPQLYRRVAAELIANPLRVAFSAERLPDAMRILLLFFANSVDGDLEPAITVAGGLPDVGHERLQLLRAMTRTVLMRVGELHIDSGLDANSLREAISSAALSYGQVDRGTLLPGRDLIVSLAENPYDLSVADTAAVRVNAMDPDQMSHLIASLALSWMLIHSWYQSKGSEHILERSVQFLTDVAKLTGVSF